MVVADALGNPDCLDPALAQFFAGGQGLSQMNRGGPVFTRLTAEVASGNSDVAVRVMVPGFRIRDLFGFGWRGLGTCWHQFEPLTRESDA